MSSYKDLAYDPASRTVREAWFIDDYFGKHRYGVRFDDDGEVYRPEQVAIPPHLAAPPPSQKPE